MSDGNDKDGKYKYFGIYYQCYEKYYYYRQISENSPLYYWHSKSKKWVNSIYDNIHDVNPSEKVINIPEPEIALVLF